MNLPDVSPKSAENNEVKPTYTLQRGGEIIVPPQCVKTRLLEAMKEKEAEGKCMICPMEAVQGQPTDGQEALFSTQKKTVWLVLTEEDIFCLQTEASGYL
uniref:Uncharacterized protein n=1 Tax=Palpitomonas bilix TaxID=652834 RepID=A0A7S3D7D6_9EUKA|mmetsp:Transcript_25626/g.64374  ORF Transcript_25626/g.64374 Transcript_25626/m.64374 type:complete len:100 (+) Transcript_25626:153-452(+)